jgi:hypothetical protein
MDNLVGGDKGSWFFRVLSKVNVLVAARAGSSKTSHQPSLSPSFPISFPISLSRVSLLIIYSITYLSRFFSHTMYFIMRKRFTIFTCSHLSIYNCNIHCALKRTALILLLWSSIRLARSYENFSRRRPGDESTINFHLMPNRDWTMNSSKHACNHTFKRKNWDEKKCRAKKY